MGKRSSLAVLSRFHRNSGAGGSWHCAPAISTTTGQCIATVRRKDRVLARSSRRRVAGDAVDADGDGLVRPRPAVASR